MSTTEIDNVLSPATSGSFQIQNGDGHTPFSNPNNVKINDRRTDVPVQGRSLKEWGAQCDLRQVNATAVAGSPTITFSNGTISPTDSGKTIAMVGTVSGIPTVIEAPIAYLSGTQGTIPYDSPFTVSTAEVVDLGHDDTASIAAALTAQKNNGTFAPIPLLVPAGNCLTHAQGSISYHLDGIATTLSQITSFPGESVFEQQGGINLEVGYFTINVDDQIDASKPWQYYDSTGAVHPVAALYQPVMAGTAYANNPLGPGWFAGPGSNSGGAINGVASVTSGSTSIAVTSATTPAAGQEIVFPYMTTSPVSAIFKTTVASVAGSTVTLSAPYPGPTDSQVEWFGGTSVQTIAQSIPASGRTYPFILALTNSTAPSPVGGSNVSGIGAVKIDSEECSYQGISKVPPYSITITACALNGTSPEAHSAGATIAPLNPFTFDTMPWPVVPTINGGTQTPANAEYYPAFNVGNYAFGVPCANGASGCSPGIFESKIHDMPIRAWPTQGSVVQNASATSPTAAFYFVGLPYSTHIWNVDLYAQFCFVEAGPSINTHYSQGGTADGFHMDGVSCHAGKYGFVAEVGAGGEAGYQDWNTYGGGGYGNLAGGGFNTALMCCDDQTGGLLNFANASLFSNIYEEPGAPSNSGVGVEWDCLGCAYIRPSFSGGGDIVIGGFDQRFTDGGIAADPSDPVLNFGSKTSFENMQGVSYTSFPNAPTPPINNVYGQSSFLSWGPLLYGCVAYGGNDGGLSSPCITPGLGNSSRPVLGQSGDTFVTGNLTAPYLDPTTGFITAAEITTSHGLDVSPMSVGWTFDDTAPITHSYFGCDTTSSSGCATDHFGGLGQIAIGPGQRLTNGLYVPVIAVRSTAGTTTFNLYLQAAYCTGSPVFYSQNVNATASWTTIRLPVVDLSQVSNCALGVGINDSSISTQIQVAYVDLAPVWQDPTAQQITLQQETPADNLACNAGAIIGTDASYIYVCTASGTVKRAALSTY